MTSLMLPMAEGDDGGFHGPQISEFFPPAFLFEGTIFEMNRIMLIRLVAAIAITLFFVWATRRMSLVPSRKQSLAEMGLGFVRNSVAVEVLGEEKGRKYTPLLTVIFFSVLAMNITGIIPFMNIAGSSVVGFPMTMAVIALVAFIWAGIAHAHGSNGLTRTGNFFKSQLFPAGVPWPIYIILTPIELISTFILRPLTLTIRLLANMMSGHFLLVLCFSATNFLFMEAAGAMKLGGVVTLAAGVAFTIFELFIAALQAFIFALLSAVYIELSTSEH
ncbi:MAG: F0F1 ATP synthase subunit A [bacterium]|nr:F0F1 ATP synthase subunit A [bacterium]